MIAKQEGTVITIASLAVISPNLLGGAAYGAAKAGVKNFMTFLHNTYRNQGIRATTILPGETNTPIMDSRADALVAIRSEEHTSELQSRVDLVCRLLLEKKKKK